MGTESRIQKAMKELMKNTTCFVIAQRISTVLDADKIIVLEDGQISAIGNHEELIKTSSVYQDIYTSQIGKGAAVNG
jgi:ATP-binding cassette subfamily B protein